MSIRYIAARCVAPQEPAGIIICTTCGVLIVNRSASADPRLVKLIPAEKLDGLGLDNEFDILGGAVGADRVRELVKLAQSHSDATIRATLRNASRAGQREQKKHGQ